MGAFLSQPLTSKLLQRKGNQYFKIGAASMQGWRDNMEDAHTIVLSMDKHPGVGFFGVFDGHCGGAASLYCAEKIWKYVDDVEDFSDHDLLTKKMIEADAWFLENQICEDGTTGIWTTVEPMEGSGNFVRHKITAANIGDSRIVLGKNYMKAPELITLSIDHKPQDPIEKTRIEEAGGYVSVNRVRGNLALSRAFGDRSYKVPTDFPPDKTQVIVVPDYIVEENVSESDFLLLACDGIYEGDIFTREQVVEWISNKLSQTGDLAQIVAELLEECKERGSRDNMSAMLILFEDGTDYQREDEYVPGPYAIGSRHSKFQEAYRKYAEKYGYSVQESRNLYAQMFPDGEDLV